MTWQLTLVGLFTGLLVGMTGMGGGSLMTPILVFLFGIPPSTAIGTDIAHGAAFKTVSAVQHRRMGNVRARLAGWMLIGSAPASLLGVWLNVELVERYGDDVESVMGQVLGAALLFGAVGLIAKSVVQGSPTGDQDWSLSNRDRVAAVLIGVFGGFIVGLTSVGSGVFFGLTLLVIFPLRAHKVVGTDIFHAAILLYVAGAAHWAAGNIDFSILGWLLLGSIPGVLIGGRLTLSIPEQRLGSCSPVCSASPGSSCSTFPSRGRSSSSFSRRARSPCSCGWRGTAGSASSAGAARPPWSSSVASRGDAHGLGELRHDRPRLPRGGCGRRRGDRRRRHAARSRSTRTDPVSARSTRSPDGSRRR